MGEKRCGALGPLAISGMNEICTNPPGHLEDHWNVHTGVSWPREPVTPSVPDTVRARVELHRAQTEYDLTVLRGQLDTIAVSTNMSRREQLSAELDAWTYLARVAKSPR